MIFLATHHILFEIASIICNINIIWGNGMLWLLNAHQLTEAIYHIISEIIFIYSVALITTYLFIGLYSIGETKKYLHKNTYTDYDLLFTNNYAPGISVLAPAYNEAKTIVENVHSLLSIDYINVEIIVINDGSKDDSLTQLITAFELEQVNFYTEEKIKTKPINGVYRSRNPLYKKLSIVDKENGGKADALNVGINIASKDYIVCIDVDCILEPDALLKVMKPFLEESDKKVIATGGVVRIANSCEVVRGKLVKVHLPEKYLPRMQTLEYIRAFILGRMAWSRLNGLMLISGAFGAFDKEIVIQAGGYNHKTVGEDMELVVRMRRYMEERKLPYVVKYIPDPLCWTEAPDNFKILGRQRNRWLRGTYETLWLHKKMFFNPKYGILGLLSYPYWFFFELCSPIIEFIGFISFLIFALAGILDWSYFILYLIVIIFFGYTYSIFAILMEVLTYHQYKRRIDITHLIFSTFTEPFYFHPFVVWSAMKGFIDKINKKSNWGEMVRIGFNKKNIVTENNTTIVQHKEEHLKQKKDRKTLEAFGNYFLKLVYFSKLYAKYIIVFVSTIITISTLELLAEIYKNGAPDQLPKILQSSIFHDIRFLFLVVISLYFPLYLAYLISRKLSKLLIQSVFFSVCIIQLMLSAYFYFTQVPLGADIFGYSWSDIVTTITASNISVYVIIAFCGIVFIIFYLQIFLPKKLNPGNISISIFSGILLILSFTGFSSFMKIREYNNYYYNNLSQNKTAYFLSASYQYLFPKHIENIAQLEQEKFVRKNFKYIDEKKYPFLHIADSSAETLSQYFKTDSTIPNIVIIIIEGLGSAFSNDEAYLGSFTPFLDSLSKHALYWSNFLSEGGRTFAALPSITGSLPFAQSGFAELGNKMPSAFTLMNLLKKHGYHSAFLYGGDASFDNMNLFMKKNGTDRIFDMHDFNATKYQKINSVNNFSWGYEDKSLYQFYFDHLNNTTPYLNVLLTLSTHEPFSLNQAALYYNKFDKHLSRLALRESDKEKVAHYKQELSTVLYADESIKYFFNVYKQRTDFAHTIFIITGDHRMPEIPIEDKLDRYHVPLIIYSPLLKKSEVFRSISTHFDITPTLIKLLQKQYRLDLPDTVAWMGLGLDTAITFRNIHHYPLKQTKTDLVDFISNEYLENQESLFRIYPNLSIEATTKDSVLAEINNRFNQFKIKNNQFAKDLKLLPDSLFKKYTE